MICLYGPPEPTFLAYRIATVIWMILGLYGARLRNIVRLKHHLPTLPYFRQLGLRATPNEAKALIIQNTVFGFDIPRCVSVTEDSTR